MGKVKKITIFGSYNGGSIGDTAILVGLLSALKREYETSIDITIMTLGDFDIKLELETIGLDLPVKVFGISNRQNNKKSIGFYNRVKHKMIGNF